VRSKALLVCLLARKRGGQHSNGKSRFWSAWAATVSNRNMTSDESQKWAARTLAWVEWAAARRPARGHAQVRSLPPRACWIDASADVPLCVRACVCLCVCVPATERRYPCVRSIIIDTAQTAGCSICHA
jgi:hypothetical protein